MLRAFVIVMLLALAAAQVGADMRSPAEPRLIIHPRNPVASLDRKFVADAFLKKVTRWPHDEQIHPVDLDVDSAVRRRFSEDVLKRSVSAIKSYWQQMVFSGRGVPPPELDSEDLIVKYVLRNPGAIGYVSGNAAIDTAKVVPLR